MTTLDDVLPRLEGVSTNGKGYMAKCPCHDDHSPSLNVWTDDDGRLAWHCHAGCDHEAVGHALEVDNDHGRGDDHPTTYKGRPIIAKYRYVDEAGALLYTVGRTADKDFPVWRPDPGAETGIPWGLADTRRVLYRLPEVRRAVAQGEPVWVTEGEKDADALCAVGITATCNPGGAEKWRPEYSQSLHGAVVKIVADKDEPGRKHARQVAQSLQGIAHQVVIVEAREGKDASDHLAAGFSVDQFVTVEDAQPMPDPLDAFVDWSALWRDGPDEPEWVVPDLIAKGRGHAFYAEHKNMKSLFMLYLSAQVATGADPVVVVYLDYEMSTDDVLERLDCMGYGPDSDLSRLCYLLHPTLPPLDTEGGGAALMELQDAVQARFSGHHIMLVIDTASRCVCGEENSADTWRNFHRHTGLALKRRGITWVRLDHAGKDPEKRQRGSSGKGDDVDVVWRQTRTENGLRLKCELARMPWLPGEVLLHMTEDPLAFVPMKRDWPEGTAEVANILDGLQVSLNATTRAAQEALRGAGNGRRREVVAAALRWRREHEREAS